MYCNDQLAYLYLAYLLENLMHKFADLMLNA